MLEDLYAFSNILLLYDSEGNVFEADSISLTRVKNIPHFPAPAIIIMDFFMTFYIVNLDHAVNVSLLCAIQADIAWPTDQSHCLVM